MSDGTTTWNFTYNADGLRTKRTNGTTTYHYVYNGDKLSQMTVGSNLLQFSYDAAGTPMAVLFNGTTYYYATNLQGDVIAILNSSGAAVVEYTYDAWGNLLATTGSMASTLGTTNPLRYRSYIYDTETQLYYLQSRYYNPEVGRFLNADAYASTGQGLLGINMFAYCHNTPTSNSDWCGERMIGLFDSGMNNIFGAGGFCGASTSIVNKGTIAPRADTKRNVKKRIKNDIKDAYNFYTTSPYIRRPSGAKSIYDGCTRITEGLTLILTPWPTLGDEIVGIIKVFVGFFDVVSGIDDLF